MGLYLNNLPNKKVEIINKIGEYIGNQNVYEPEINLSLITKKNWDKNIKTKCLICIIDNANYNLRWYRTIVYNNNNLNKYGEGIL